MITNEENIFFQKTQKRETHIGKAQGVIPP